MKKCPLLIACMVCLYFVNALDVTVHVRNLGPGPANSKPLFEVTVQNNKYEAYYVQDTTIIQNRLGGGNGFLMAFFQRKSNGKWGEFKNAYERGGCPLNPNGTCG